MRAATDQLLLERARRFEKEALGGSAIGNARWVWPWL